MCCGHAKGIIFMPLTVMATWSGSITCHAWIVVYDNGWSNTIMHTSRENNMILLHANNKDTDQPAHRRRQVSAFFDRSIESINCMQYFNTIANLRSWASWPQPCLNLKPRSQVLSGVGQNHVKCMYRIFKSVCCQCKHLETNTCFQFESRGVSLSI